MNSRVTKLVPLDETDRAILRHVLDDPRVSIADIARVVGVQRDTVKYRMERMEKRGVITKYHAIIEPAALGLTVFMQVLIKTAPVPKEQLQEFVHTIILHKNVTHVSRLVGKYDYLLQVAAIDIEAFDIVLDEIKAIQPGIITEIELASIIDGLKTDDFSGLV